MNIAQEVDALQQMTIGALQDRYVEVFGEAVHGRHKQYLIRPIEIGPGPEAPLLHHVGSDGAQQRAFQKVL